MRVATGLAQEPHELLEVEFGGLRIEGDSARELRDAIHEGG